MLLCLIFLPIVKKRVYEVFLLTHAGCALVMIYSIWRHTQSQGKQWIFPLIYLSTFTLSRVGQLTRILYRNIVIGGSPVRLHVHPYVGDLVPLTISLPRPWKVRAGEHIRLGVPHIGIFYSLQTHPFTICWWDSNDRGQAASVSILLRPRSGFTRKLIEQLEPRQQCRAWFDGPFGPSSVNWKLDQHVGSYGHLLMFATGIGIAAQIPYIKEVIDGHNRAQVCTQRISLVWQLDHPNDWGSASDWLQDLVAQDAGYVSSSLYASTIYILTC